MEIVDYNGEGFWSAEAVVRRYQEHARRLRVRPSRELAPQTSGGKHTLWIWPIMHEVIVGIEAGDLACAEIGVEFIEESGSFAFGKILKSNTARALRRGVRLTAAQENRVRARVLAMLKTEYMPREFREYVRLARKVGMADEIAAATKGLNLTNPWVHHYAERLSAP